MKVLTLLSFLFVGAFALADDSNLQSADVIDQELLETFGDVGGNSLADDISTDAVELNAQALTRGGHGGPRGGHGGGWGHRPFPRPVPRPYPFPRPHWPRPVPPAWPNPTPAPRLSVACFADNEFGQRFTGWGYWATDAQQQALNDCYRFSRVCYARGCNYY